MKTNRTLIAICIATIFASGSLCAKDKWEYHTDGWEKTKSYGSVMVANDTAKQWGPWEDFVEPAAGAPSIAFIGAGADDPYNVLPNPIPPNPEVGCLAGEWCGYIAARVKSMNRHGESGGERRGGGEGEGGGHGGGMKGGEVFGGKIALAFQPSDGPWPWGGPWNEGAVNLRLLTDVAGYGAGAETGMIPVEFGGPYWWTPGHQGYFEMAEKSLYLDDTIKITRFEGGSDGFNWYTRTWVNDYATMGVLEAYIYGDDERKEAKIYAPFVAGQVTADMPGNVTATYKGETALGEGRVSMYVNFGTSQWYGTFNEHGKKGFEVSVSKWTGNVNGANFTATNFDPSCGWNVSGSVNGMFYGPKAAAAGGLIDVTRTPSSTESRAAPQQYVDVFLANKVFQKPNPVVVPTGAN